MNKLLKKEESALRTPYKMLLFTALIFPCLNILIVGSAMLVTHYFGAFYSYTAAGTALTLLYELLSSLFHILNYCLMTCTILTLGSVVFKKTAKSALLPALFAFLAGFAEILCSTVSLSVTVSAGVSDSTAALPSQLFPLILGGLTSLLPRAPLYGAVVLAYLVAKRRSADLRVICYEKTPFALTSLLIVALYTLSLFIDPITVALAPGEDVSLFSGYILPFLYPLIYGGFMGLTVLFFPTYLVRYYKRKPLFGKKKAGSR